MSKLILILSLFIGCLTHSSIDAEVYTIEAAQQLCLKEIYSKGNGDEALLYGINALKNLDRKTKTEEIYKLKGLICIACRECSPENFIKVVAIADEVIKFGPRVGEREEICYMFAQLIKNKFYIVSDKESFAKANICIVNLQLINYTKSKFFNRIMYNSIESILNVQKDILQHIND